MKRYFLPFLLILSLLLPCQVQAVSTFYMDYISGNDSTTTTPLGWWSVSVTSPAGSKPAAGETMTQGANTAVLTVTPATWTGTVVLYFYGKVGTFASGAVTFTGGGSGSIGADLTYCAWQTITSGALAARIAPGDTIRIRGGIGNRYPGDTTVLDGTPQSLGNGTWTNASATVTLAANTDTSNIDMAETAWGDAANVTCTRTGTTQKEGTYAMYVAVATAFTTGTVAWYNTGTLDLQAYQGMSFWIYSDVAVAANSLRLDLFTDTGSGDTAPTAVADSVTIPFKLEAARWYPVSLMKTGGGNLNAAVTSVGITVLIDLSTTAVVTLRIDDILAIKSSGLSIQSLLGRNVAGESWWALKSINGTTVILGESQQVGTSVTNYNATDGVSPGSVTTYRRETIKTTLATATTTAIQSTQDIGTYASLINYSGGWSIVTNAQGTGETWFDGLNGWGFGLNVAGTSYCYFEKLGFVRYRYGAYGNSNAYISLSNLQTNGNNNTGFYQSYNATSYLVNHTAVQNITNGIFCSVSPAEITNIKALTNGYGIVVQGSPAVIYGGTLTGNTTADVDTEYGAVISSYNLTVGSTQPYSTLALNGNGYWRSMLENGTPNNHKTRCLYNGKSLTTFYTISYDSVIFNTATPSLRLTPNNATYKAESAPPGEGIKVPVASGSTVTFNAYVRYGTGYVGSVPRLMVRRNDLLGYTADTVLDTHSGGAGWELVSGTTIAALADGAFEFFVDCDGTVGWINIDDLSK